MNYGQYKTEEGCKKSADRIKTFARVLKWNRVPEFSVKKSKHLLSKKIHLFYAAPKLSPPGVPVYAEGSPKISLRLIFVRFDHRASFFTVPFNKRGRGCKKQ